METYVILAKFKQPGGMNPQSAGEMMAQTQKTADALGVKIASWLMLMGQYDVAYTIQTDNAGTAAKFAMFLGSAGLRTETLRAFTAEEAMGLLG